MVKNPVFGMRFTEPEGRPVLLNHIHPSFVSRWCPICDPSDLVNLANLVGSGIEPGLSRLAPI
jgi:hypothetical protein